MAESPANGGLRPLFSEGDAPEASNKKRKTSSSTSTCTKPKKAYPIIEVHEENNPAAPLLKQAIILNLQTEASTGDVIRQTIERHAPEFHYVNEDINSLSTGSGTSLGVDFLEEPIQSIAHLLAEGGWRLIAVIKRRNGDAFAPLPDKILREIFGHVGDAFSLQACERSCARFRSILSDDDAWRYCEGADGVKGGSFREKAFISSVCGGIRKEQQLTRNIIQSVLSPELIRKVVNDETFLRSIPSSFPTYDSTSKPAVDFYVRGDALGCLLDIIEDYMLEKMCQVAGGRYRNPHVGDTLGGLISVLAGKKSSAYPEVTRETLNLIKHIQDRSGKHFFLKRIWNWGECRKVVEKEVNVSTRFKLARRLAYRGGIVKITDEALLDIAEEVFLLMAFLLRRPLHYFYHAVYGKTVLQYESEEEIDLWNDIPPVLYDPAKERTIKIGATHYPPTGPNLLYPASFATEDRPYSFVVVPGLIEDAAAEVGLSCYGSQWLVSGGQTLESETKEAKARYMLKLEDYPDKPLDSLPNLDSSDGSECDSLSETTDDGEFSEYDDAECPDVDTDGE